MALFFKPLLESYYFQLKALLIRADWWGNFHSAGFSEKRRNTILRPELLVNISNSKFLWQWHISVRSKPIYIRATKMWRHFLYLKVITFLLLLPQAIIHLVIHQPFDTLIRILQSTRSWIPGSVKHRPPCSGRAVRGAGEHAGLTYSLHVVGADDATYLPQVLQQQIQDLGGSLLLVVAELLQLAQLSLGGCQCGLKTHFHNKLKGLPIDFMHSVPQWITTWRQGEFCYHFMWFPYKGSFKSNNSIALNSLTRRESWLSLLCYVYISDDNLQVSEISY